MTRMLATFFGAGLAPVAPGTFGSLAALPLGLLILILLGPWGLIIAAFVAFVLGLWATEQETKGKSEHDPSEIVIDEVVGQWLAMIPMGIGMSPISGVSVVSILANMALAFLLFRAFDILKPFPVSWADRMQTPFGVMFDDVSGGADGCILYCRVSSCFRRGLTMTTRHLATKILALAREKQLVLSVAESCTGGLLAGALTDIPGSSDVFDRGYVTYSNTAKTQMLGVPDETITKYGAVSSEVAALMATGCLKEAQTDIALSITGVAGPGASAAKPEGLVWFGIATKTSNVMTERRDFGAIGRSNVRQASVTFGLELLMEALRDY